MLSIRTILHPTDFSTHSGYAFQLACSLARDHGARVLVLHVVMPPTAAAYRSLVLQGEFDGSYESLLQQLKAIRPTIPDIPVEHCLKEGDAGQVILAMAQALKPDMIIMGTHGRLGLGQLMGSVAEKIVRQSPYPVLTVKAPQGGHEALDANTPKPAMAGSELPAFVGGPDHA